MPAETEAITLDTAGRFVSYELMHFFRVATLLLASTLVACALGCNGEGNNTSGGASSGSSTSSGSNGGSGGGDGTGGSASSSASASSGGAGGAGGPSCAGQCVPAAPLGWDMRALLWFGDEASAPACPSGSTLGYEGHADLDAAFDCGVCTCDAPAGSCALPTTITANAASCALDGPTTPHTPFNASANWDGTCDANGAIPAGKLCSGIQCVQSVTVAPLGMTEGACAPSSAPAIPAATWKTFARGCAAEAAGTCADTGDACVATTPVGFRACVYHEGDVACPAGPYTDKHVFYADFVDSRACSACSCSAPSGGACTSTISVYTDGACTSPAFNGTIGADMPVCKGLPPGTPLGSKSATPPVYTPGTCSPSGGAQSGSAAPMGASTFCCMP